MNLAAIHRKRDSKKRQVPVADEKNLSPMLLPAAPSWSASARSGNGQSGDANAGENVFEISKLRLGRNRIANFASGEISGERSLSGKRAENHDSCSSEEKRIISLVSLRGIR
jgi:hypothetical protein